MTKSTESSTIIVHIPMKFAIRGGRKTIIFDTAAPTTERRSENGVLKALARGHRWRRQIETGEFSSITELAKARKVNQSYACRLLRLTLLAPTIVTKILDGQGKSNLALNQLAKPLPLGWSDQMRLLALETSPTAKSDP